MSLSNLPYDILFNIVRLLDVEELVNLGRTCRQLQRVCGEPSLCRIAAQRNIPYAWETRLARIGTISYSDALRRVYQRRSALARGAPHVAEIVGSASQFVYDDGIICFQHDDFICILETLNFGRKFILFIRDLLQDVAFDSHCPPKLLRCSHSILSILHSNRDVGHDLLLVFKINFADGVLERICSIQLASSARIFVRNTEDYLYYGTHSFLGSRNHYEWVVQGISLHSDRPFPEEARHTDPERTEIESRCVYLTDFTGSGVGSDVAFQIHGNEFYAVTNCDDSDVIEVDWTSFYRCVKFPIHDPRIKNVQKRKIFRRQHNEGPLHDSWTNLTLQVDERSNDLIIVEARKEWLDGRRQSRSFYMSDIHFPASDRDSDLSCPEVCPAPPNGLFATLASDRSTFMASVPRAHWQVHPEEENIFANHHRGKHSRTAQQFIVAETKFKAYSLSARTFIDIVDDPSCCESYSDTAKRTSCLRIRTGTRHVGQLQLLKPPSSSESSPSEPSSPASYDSSSSRSSCYLLPTDEYEIEGPTPYEYKPISLWPNASSASFDDEQAHDVMNPIDTNSVDVQAASDDRMIVLLLRDGCGLRDRRSGGKLVVLSFDAEVKIRESQEKEKKEKHNNMCILSPAGLAGLSASKSACPVQTTIAQEASQADDDCLSLRRREDVPPDVQAYMARGRDEYFTQHTELDFSDAGWGW